MWKGIIQKQFKRVFCAKVFGNGVMKYNSSLSTNDHKSKAHIELQLWAFGYGFNFAPSSKNKKTSKEHYGAWPWDKFEQFQH